jgi:hypothetical protein
MPAFILRSGTDENMFVTEARYNEHVNIWYLTWEERPGQVKVFYNHSSWKEIQEMIPNIDRIVIN